MKKRSRKDIVERILVMIVGFAVTLVSPFMNDLLSTVILAFIGGALWAMSIWA